MRIGIDMLGNQSDSRHRGIGRYTRNLVGQLLVRHPRHQYFLYYHEGLPGPDEGWPGQSTQRAIAADGPGRGTRAGTERLTRENPDGLDLLVLTSAFEHVRGYLPPPRPLNGLKLAAVLYDLIPTLFEDRYLADSAAAGPYYQALETVRQYDLLLAISEASRIDCARVMGIAAERVHNISAAADRGLFFPRPAAGGADEGGEFLARLRIGGRFVYCLAACDYRKNVPGLFAAYALLPRRLRENQQLVVTCGGTEAEVGALEALAAEAGIIDELVLTGLLPDRDVRTLYQRCEAFVFPSRYEGFGLPVLEAMHCGAAVLAGDNSSQIEVVGDAGLLADVDDPADVAGQLARLLEDKSLVERLRAEAPIQASRFSWEETADRCQEAIEDLFAKRSHGRSIRRRLAWLSPLPPERSAAAVYAAHLLEELASRYTIDLFHDAGFIPHAAIASPRFACHDYRLFERYAAALDYTAVLYQLGDGSRQTFISETLRRHPGPVVLHGAASSAAIESRYDWVFDHCPQVVFTDRSGFNASRRRLTHLAGRMHCFAGEQWPATGRRFAELIDGAAGGGT